MRKPSVVAIVLAAVVIASCSTVPVETRNSALKPLTIDQQREYFVGQSGKFPNAITDEAGVLLPMAREHASRVDDGQRGIVSSNPFDQHPVTVLVCNYDAV